MLLFTEALATLESLRELLRADGIEALAYHGDLPLVERDRQVARFRDPDGPRLLVCTEVGGEGRNFQFAHHLILFAREASSGRRDQPRDRPRPRSPCGRPSASRFRAWTTS